MSVIKLGHLQLTSIQFPKTVTEAICRGLREPDILGVRSPEAMIQVIQTIESDLDFLKRDITVHGAKYKEFPELLEKNEQLKRVITGFEELLSANKKLITKVSGEPFQFCVVSLRCYWDFEDMASAMEKLYGVTGIPKFVEDSVKMQQLTKDAEEAKMKSIKRIRNRSTKIKRSSVIAVNTASTSKAKDTSVPTPTPKEGAAATTSADVTVEISDEDTNDQSTNLSEITIVDLD